ncbi:MAG: xanthine dehydrogenase family protein molybdopterin-binding subunit, partial [Streptosporangiales bacterium]
MTTLQEPVTEIGQARTRKEDEHLVTGRTSWTDNLTLPGLMHMAILRSPMAHARITNVDVSPAREQPGVVAAFAGADLAAEQGSLPCAWPVTPDMVLPDHPALAVDTVTHVGQPVAVVVATSAYAAADAVEAIEADYEPLPVVTEMEAALADGADLVHPDKGTNRAFTWTFDSGEAGSGGSVNEAFAGAEVRVKRRYRQQRLIPAFMEPRSVMSA